MSSTASGVPVAALEARLRRPGLRPDSLSPVCPAMWQGVLHRIRRRRAWSIWAGADLAQAKLPPAKPPAVHQQAPSLVSHSESTTHAQSFKGFLHHIERDIALCTLACIPSLVHTTSRSHMCGPKASIDLSYGRGRTCRADLPLCPALAWQYVGR